MNPTKELWDRVSGDLQGAALEWWRANEGEITALAMDELEDLGRGLKRGKIAEAQLAIVARMNRQEWVAYRDGTTAALKGIAITRARILAALEDLGERSARVIGKALAHALGL